MKQQSAALHAADAAYVACQYVYHYTSAARLHGDLAGCFEIKLRASGYRFIYKVIDEEIVIWGIAAGKRERRNDL